MTYDCIPLGTGAGPAVYWMTDAAFSAEAVIKLLSGVDGLLVVCQVSDWNHSLTPWPAPPAFGREGFTGGAGETLYELVTRVVPRVEEKFGKRQCYVCGYSLGGLFALWALWESPMFSGAASCSGSLWYPGWMAYFAGKPISREMRVYLSLGTHEERTHNKTLSAVGPATRQTYEILQQSAEAVLEWNPGGHFREPEARMARGIRWLLGEEQL